MIEETHLDDLIRHQLAVINMSIKSVNVLSIVDKIEVSKTRVEIFFKNLPIKSCYYDGKLRKLYYDSLSD